MNDSTIIPSPKTPSAATSRGNGNSLQSNTRRKKGKSVEALSAGDSAEARSRVLLAAIVAFRDGDFSVRLPADWAGTEGRIAEAFKQVIAYEARIAREVSR